MRRSVLVPLAILVTSLLALVALASRGNPLGGSARGGTGPSTGFFDYVFTSFVLAAAIVVLAGVWGFLRLRPNGRPPADNYRLFATLLFLSVAGGAAWYLATHGAFHRGNRGVLFTLRTATAPPAATETGRPGTHDAQLRWDEIAVVLGLLAGFAAIAVLSRRRRPLPAPFSRARQEAVSASLDESLDDLRAEPDLRKAIVAAYARMELALAAAGLPRQPAEAPLEFLERALLELDTSAGAVRRLTDLFEWAKFSQHEPEPRMRDEAVDALVAVRDELRAPAREEALA